MSTPLMSQIATANDKAEILALIHSRLRGVRSDNGADLVSRDLTIAMSGDSAVCRGVVRMATRKEAAGAEEFWVRESMRLERKAEGWRIVCEQISAPFSWDGGLRDGWIAGSRLRVDWAPHGAAIQTGC